MKISPGMARDLGNEVRGGQIYFSLLFYLTIKCKLYNLTFGPFWAKTGGATRWHRKFNRPFLKNWLWQNILWECDLFSKKWSTIAKI